MTREEKRNKMERLSKRIDRFYSWVEYYKINNPTTLMLCALKGVYMVSELKTLASQPTNDMKHQNPRFPKGGILINNQNQ